MAPGSQWNPSKLVLPSMSTEHAKSAALSGQPRLWHVLLLFAIILHDTAICKHRNSRVLHFHKIVFKLSKTKTDLIGPDVLTLIFSLVNKTHVTSVFTRVSSVHHLKEVSPATDQYLHKDSGQGIQTPPIPEDLPFWESCEHGSMMWVRPRESRCCVQNLQSRM